MLTGYQPRRRADDDVGPGRRQPGVRALAAILRAGRSLRDASSGQPGSVPTAAAEIDPDSVPGQLGALRDRFGLDDDHVNTVDEEKQRTSFWTLVELITDLQRSWDTRRLDFTLGAGNGFLGTDLVQISRLLAAASEQVDEFEAVLDSVLVSGAERQTVVLDRDTGLTLDDLVQWLRVFFTEDGPNIIRDTGPRRARLVVHADGRRAAAHACGTSSCADSCRAAGRRAPAAATAAPAVRSRASRWAAARRFRPGMYAGRVKIAVSTLCGLVERLTAKAIRIGRFAGAVLLDLSVVPFDDTPDGTADVAGETSSGSRCAACTCARPTCRRSSPTEATRRTSDPSSLPLQGSASADADQHLRASSRRPRCRIRSRTCSTGADPRRADGRERGAAGDRRRRAGPHRSRARP